MGKNQFSLKEEYNNVPSCNKRKAKEAVINLLKFRSEQGFYKRINEITDTSEPEKEAIKRIFRRYQNIFEKQNIINQVIEKIDTGILDKKSFKSILTKWIKECIHSKSGNENDLVIFYKKGCGITTFIKWINSAFEKPFFKEINNFIDKNQSKNRIVTLYEESNIKEIENKINLKYQDVLIINNIDQSYNQYSAKDFINAILENKKD